MTDWLRHLITAVFVLVRWVIGCVLQLKQQIAAKRRIEPDNQRPNERLRILLLTLWQHTRLNVHIYPFDYWMCELKVWHHSNRSNSGCPNASHKRESSKIHFCGVNQHDWFSILTIFKWVHVPRMCMKYLAHGSVIFASVWWGCVCVSVCAIGL